VCNIFFRHAATAPSGPVGPNMDAARSHSDESQSVGLLWTSDQPDAENSTWRHTTLSTHTQPFRGRDSNPQSQQTSGCRPTLLRPRDHCTLCNMVIIQGEHKWLSGFWQLVIHNTLEIGVCSCTDGSRNSQSFLLWCAVCSSYAFLRLELQVRIRTTADMLQTVWNELDYRVDVCRIKKGAHIEHL